MNPEALNWPATARPTTVRVKRVGNDAKSWRVIVAGKSIWSEHKSRADAELEAEWLRWPKEKA